MRYSIFFLGSLFLGLFIPRASAQDAVLQADMQVGKCYAPILTPHGPILYRTETYPIYTGSNPKVKLKTLRLPIVPDTYEWVSRKLSPEACERTNNENCQYWRQTMEAGIFDTITVVRKPWKVPAKDIEYRDYQVAYYEYPGTGAPHYEIICKTDLSYDLIVEVQSALMSYAYEINDLVEGVITSGTRSAIAQYQIDLSLRPGPLTYETLEALGINN